MRTESRLPIKATIHQIWFKNFKLKLLFLMLKETISKSWLRHFHQNLILNRFLGNLFIFISLISAPRPRTKVLSLRSPSYYCTYY